MLSNRFADALRGSTGNPLERFAQSVKDFLLDWEIEDEPLVEVPADELPPLDPQEFVQSLQVRVTEVLLQMATAINEAPTGQIVDDSEQRIAELLAELGAEIVARGVKMRLQAAAAQSAAQPPQGRWAEKYRLMRAAGDQLPDPP
jgi:hypothetical protein